MKERPQMMFQVRPNQKTSNTYEIYIYDEVTARDKFDWMTWTTTKSETSANFFREKLSGIPEGAKINLYINSNGGDVGEGLGIYNQLKRHGANVTGYVDGYAYSVAFLILMACDHRVMNLGTTALLHNMWMNVSGNADELREYADMLDKMMESNRQIFLEACGHKITEEKLIEMMNAETILTPDECMEYGFIHEVAKEMDPEDNPEKNPETDPEDNPEDLELKQATRIALMQIRQKKEAQKKEQLKNEINNLFPAEKTEPENKYQAASSFFEKLSM